MSADKENNIKWVATRKVDGEIEYLVSHTSWNPDKRFAKVFDTKTSGGKYMREPPPTGPPRPY